MLTRARLSRQSFMILRAESMKLLLICVFLPLVFAQSPFGSSYLKNSRLCLPWKCLNDHFGLSDSLPRKEDYTRLLEDLLPEGPWRASVGPILDICYGTRPRRYTNTCPGQALLHCFVDQLIENCPNESLVAKDACAPVTSIAGFLYMFSQSRYTDLEKNLPSDRRPAWFLKNYFDSKCCELPPFVNQTLLTQCGFNSLIHYYQQQTRTLAPAHTYKVETKQSEKGEVLQVVQFDDIPTTPNAEEYGEYDPLDCCDMHELIPPTARSSCDFQLRWDPETRLSIINTTITTTTTEAPKTLKAKDVKMVPQSCEASNCVFRALNIVSESGSVDIDAFSKFLNNLTDIHPEWTKAKGRVFTKCLRRPIRDYEYDCEINKVLACTFDVLSENCPNASTRDVCRHSSIPHNDVICQISSSKYRPKSRRLFCAIPNLISFNTALSSQCNINSLIRLEYVPETLFKPRTSFSSVTSMVFSKKLGSKRSCSNTHQLPPMTTVTTPNKTHKDTEMCTDLTPSTLCLMEKMGVLNKYDFMDYFKMKDKIRKFSYGEWFPYSAAYTAVFQSVPLYRQYCSSPKKLLNVVDTMLMTCPFSKRRHSPQCDKMFSDLTKEMTKNSPQSEQLIKLFGHVFITNQHLDLGLIPPNTVLRTDVRTNPIYDFGMFNSDDAPPVQTIDVHPKTTRAPLVLLPVYQRMPFNYNKENIMRNSV